MAMTIYETLQDASSKANVPTLRYAKLDEFQSFMDSFKSNEYPINVVVPFESRGTWGVGSRRKQVIPLQGWIVTRVTDDAIDIRSSKAEELYINPMRTLITKFLRQLISSDITDAEVPLSGISDTIKPEHGFLTMQVIGVSYTINWPVSEHVC